jgi:DNA-binding LacI/PurR family transcriptional regulator
MHAPSQSQDREHLEAPTVAFIGMDNSPVATQTKPRLTTIGYDMIAGTRSIAAAITDEKEPKSAPALDFEMIQGGTT